MSEIVRKTFDVETLVEMRWLCGFCQCQVDNRDPGHLVTPILQGGRGVECVLRGDLDWAEAGPLRSIRADS
jgi:hypothetical protein